MRKTYLIIKYDKNNMFSIDSLKQPLDSFDVSNTGFVVPNCEVTIECDENKHIFASSLRSYEQNEFLEQEEIYNTVTLVITHKDSFTGIINDKFINDLYNSILLQSVEKVVSDEYEIDIIISACI